MIHISFALAFFIFSIAGMWKAFEKANQPGWACIVPIYNLVVMLKLAELPGWYVILLFIPLVNFFILFLVYDGISHGFKKGLGFTLGLFLLSPIFWMILGFGDSSYSPKAPLAPQ